MRARFVAVALALVLCSAPSAEAQTPSRGRALSISEIFPFSPTTTVRVLAISEKSATALRRHEIKTSMLLELEFDAGTKGTTLTLAPRTATARTAFVLSIGEQRFPVDYIAFHRLDQIPGWFGGPADEPQVITVTNDLYCSFIFAGRAKLGLLFNIPPEAVTTPKKILEIRFSKEREAVLVSVGK